MLRKEKLVLQDDVVMIMREGESAARKTVGVSPFMEAISRLSGARADEIAPPGAKASWSRGDYKVLLIEIPPQTKVVQWICRDSVAKYGDGIKDAPVSIALPYIEIMLQFREGLLTGKQRLYYRTRPVESTSDVLHQSNLLNVSDVPGDQRAWLCLQSYRVNPTHTWEQKIKSLITFMWTWTFSESSEHHEGNSYFQRNRALDPRIATVEAWKKASSENPNFMLGINWPAMPGPTGNPLTVGDVVSEMLGTRAGLRITHSKQLINVAKALPAAGR